jgi:hypothetical protein
MKEIIIIALIIVVFAFLFGISIDYQKSKCLEEGGKWVSGMIGGEMSYFCMPN